MTARLADTAARFLARTPSRRNFLKRSAMAGTALAVAPADFVLRPGTAYGAICNCSGSACACGSLCCDGYTEFCCTMTGSNSCPPGTIAAGWWKADGSSYCAGPRYYIDCNATCRCGSGTICPDSCSNAPWGCGCAKGDCNNRKAGCTQFRYGQCNRQVATVGRIACRVVSCDAAVLVVSNCAPTVAVDNSTANHNKPCLQAPPPAAPFAGLTVPEEEEDSMPPINRIAYPGDGSLHTFYVSADGHLRHKWDDSGGATRDEDLSRLLGLGPVQQERPLLAITPDGDLLVGIYGTDGIFNDIRWNKQAVRWEQWVGH
jgi:hypothetical protein